MKPSMWTHSGVFSDHFNQYQHQAQKGIHTCGHTSFRELKEVTYECAIVPVTGIPNRKPAWTLLVRSKPERKIPLRVCVCVYHVDVTV